MGRHGATRTGGLVHRSVRAFGLAFLPFTLAVAILAATIGRSEAAVSTEMVSRDSTGVIANAGSTVSAVSADGHTVAFASGASNLVPGDGNAAFDVFVRDLATGTTERVSVDSTGAEANGVSQTPAISADGQVVAFVSRATNLVAGDTNGRFDVFVHDRSTGVTERVSVHSSGTQASADSLLPWISADGRRVVFTSSAADLVAGDTNSTFDVFFHDRDTATTVRMSVDSTGAQANGPSLAPRVSADGLVVVFHSSASNLVAGDTNAVLDVFVHDLSTGVTERVSVAAEGSQGLFQSVAGSLSADGRFVSFNSDATNLVPGDGNFRTDVFVRDRLLGTVERASLATGGAEGDGQSGFQDPAAFSLDANRVVFTSGATNLVPADGNSVVDVFVRDRAAGTTERVSVASDGTEADGPSTLWPTISADGSVVVLASSATNLVADDGNFVQDVFAHVSAVTCGNGAPDPGEECDDGNIEDGDCCSATCTFESPETACDDGDACTSGDHCSAGACVSGTLDPEACLDDMSCYLSLPLGPALKPGKVSVVDALHAGFVSVRGPEDLCSSVDLFSSSDPSPGTPRMSCHDADQEWKNGSSFASRKVTVVNRLGTQRFKIYEPTQVCLAAGREAPPAAGVLDNFTCYRANRLFEPSKHPRGRPSPPEPMQLCLASDLGDAPAAHPDVHLACYQAPDPGWWNIFRKRKETVKHLYGTETLLLVPERSLCVPSTVTE